MLDLKAQLAAAGLVTKEDIEAVEARARGRRGKGGKGGKGRGAVKPAAAAAAGLDLASLASAGKGERYDAIRRAVDKRRLDNAGPIPSESAEPFHYTTEAGVVGRVFVEPLVRGRLEDGSAAIVAHMSNHGLAHAVVPIALGRAVGELFPAWLRFPLAAAEPPAAAAVEDPPDAPPQVDPAGGGSPEGGSTGP